MLATFKYGTDMAEAENQITAAVSNVPFITGVEESTIERFNPDQFPVIQFSVISDLDTTDLQEIVQSRFLPAIADIEGIQKIQGHRGNRSKGPDHSRRRQAGGEQHSVVPEYRLL